MKCNLCQNEFFTPEFISIPLPDYKSYLTVMVCDEAGNIQPLCEDCLIKSVESINNSEQI